MNNLTPRGGIGNRVTTSDLVTATLQDTYQPLPGDPGDGNRTN